jgi:hypothetical protein
VIRNRGGELLVEVQYLKRSFKDVKAGAGSSFDIPGNYIVLSIVNFIPTLSGRWCHQYRTEFGNSEQKLG